MTTPDPHTHDAQPDDHAARDAERQEILAEREQLRTKIKDVDHTRTRATFVGLVIGAIITILLLVFILQNLNKQQITLLAWEVNLPIGVSLLIAAIAGALITALIGGARMFQLNRALKRASKNL
ncbi:lipopolysaccharide assembly protein LapA domain-containing protein [Gordonia sinesedis]